MPYALITGGSKGIGKAIAMQLAARKFDLLLVARDEQALIKTAKEISAAYDVSVKYLSIDLSLPDSPTQVFDYCTQQQITVQVLVNNAGYGLAGNFDSWPLSAHLNMLGVNITALVSLTAFFIPSLKKLPQAHILNIASSAAYQAVPGLGLYAASKSFVLNFSRSLNVELARTSIAVTCACPGGTDTDFVVRARVGAKALKFAEKVNMQPDAVAALAVKAMLNKKTEVVTGGINKIGVFFAWLLPKKLVENSTAKIYATETA